MENQGGLSLGLKAILQCPICTKVIGSGCTCQMYDILQKFACMLAELNIELEQAYGQINMLCGQIEGAGNENDQLRKQVSQEQEHRMWKEVQRNQRSMEKHAKRERKSNSDIWKMFHDIGGKDEFF